MKIKLSILLMFFSSVCIGQVTFDYKTKASFNTDTSQLLAKRDTASFANGIRNSISIADCMIGVTSFGASLGSGSSGSVSVTHNKTSPVVILSMVQTSNSPTLSYVLYATDITNTTLNINVNNNGATAFTPTIHYQVCKN